MLLLSRSTRHVDGERIREHGSAVDAVQKPAFDPVSGALAKLVGGIDGSWAGAACLADRSEARLFQRRPSHSAKIVMTFAMIQQKPRARRYSSDHLTVWFVGVRHFLVDITRSIPLYQAQLPGSYQAVTRQLPGS